MSIISSLINSSEVSLGVDDDERGLINMFFKWKSHQVSVNQFVISVEYETTYPNYITQKWYYTFLVPTKIAENQDEFLSEFAENIIIDTKIYNRQRLWNTLIDLAQNHKWKYKILLGENKEEYYKYLKKEDIIILEDTSLLNSSSYFEYEIFIGNLQYEGSNKLYKSDSNLSMFIKICYKYKELSSNQHAVLASFYFRGSNTPNYIWTYLFIYNNESLDKIQFFNDFVNHVLLTDSMYVDLGLYYKMHFQNSIEQEELDDGRNYDQNRFLKFLKDNNVIIIENHHLRISEHDEDMKPPYQPDMQGSINIDKFLFKQDDTTCQVYYFNFS